MKPRGAERDGPLAKARNLRRAHGEALRQRGDREGAIAQVREAVALEPNNGDHHVQLGFLLFQAQNFAEARPSLERGLALRQGTYSGGAC